MDEEEIKGRRQMKYIMEIKPALLPEERHLIEQNLKQLGYHVIGGGTDTDMSSCDISFEKGLSTIAELEAISEQKSWKRQRLTKTLKAEQEKVEKLEGWLKYLYFYLHGIVLTDKMGLEISDYIKAIPKD